MSKGEDSTFDKHAGETPCVYAVDLEVKSDPSMQPSAKISRYRRLAKDFERDIGELKKQLALTAPSADSSSVQERDSVKRIVADYDDEKIDSNELCDRLYRLSVLSSASTSEFEQKAALFCSELTREHCGEPLADRAFDFIHRLLHKLADERRASSSHERSSALAEAKRRIENERQRYFDAHGSREDDTNATGFSNPAQAMYDEGLGDALNIIEEVEKASASATRRSE